MIERFGDAAGLSAGRGSRRRSRFSPVRRRLARDNFESQSTALAIFAVGEARFLQIEVALDPPPGLVGDLAVAQQRRG
jgi:hypothetical protein